VTKRSLFRRVHVVRSLLFFSQVNQSLGARCPRMCPLAFFIDVWVDWVFFLFTSVRVAWQCIWGVGSFFLSVLFFLGRCGGLVVLFYWCWCGFFFLS